MIPQKGPQVALLPPMNLYREDLEKIVSVFRQHCRNVTIGDQENVYGSMDEMAERAPRPRCFAVTGSIPHGELVIRGDYLLPLGVRRSTLWTMQIDVRSDAVFLAIREFLFSRRQSLVAAFRDGVLFVASVLALACLFSKVFGGRHFGTRLEYDITVLLCVGLFALSIYVHGRQASFISLNFRSKRQSFWERISDQIGIVVLGMSVGILGALVAEWITYLIFRVPK